MDVWCCCFLGLNVFVILVSVVRECGRVDVWKCESVDVWMCRCVDVQRAEGKEE